MDVDLSRGACVARVGLTSSIGSVGFLNPYAGSLKACAGSPMATLSSSTGSIGFS
jgi:hypothetical protein